MRYAALKRRAPAAGVRGFTARARSLGGSGLDSLNHFTNNAFFLAILKIPLGICNLKLTPAGVRAAASREIRSAHQHAA